MIKENTEIDELQRRLHDAHESSAMLRDKIDRLEAEKNMSKVYLLQFVDWSDYFLITIGAYSSVENILRLDTEKEFNNSDGEYRIVEFHIDGSQSRRLKTKTVWSNGKTEGWQDNKAVDRLPHS
jgi:hypothetical protein